MTLTNSDTLQGEGAYFVSDEQQDAVIGRTVKEYAECRKKLAALQQEAARLTDSTKNISQILHHIATIESPAQPFTVILRQQLGGFPTTETLITLANSVDVELQRKRQFHHQLKEMGFEPKD